MSPAKQAPQRQHCSRQLVARRKKRLPRSGCIHSGNRTREFHRSRGRRYSCFNWREPLNGSFPALKAEHAQPDVARGQGGAGLYANTPLTGAQAPEPPPSLHCSFQPRTLKKVSRPYSEGPRAGKDMSSRARKDSPTGIILQVYSAQTPTTSIKTFAVHLLKQRDEVTLTKLFLHFVLIEQDIAEVRDASRLLQ